MRNEEWLVLGLAGLALWFITKGKSTMGAAQAQTSGYATHAAPDYQGWQYFTDGTSISPEGAYYKGGLLVWQP